MGSGGSLGATRILLVEDDGSLSEATSEELRARGHHVVAAASVGEARRSLHEQEFDVALLDLSLPDGDGLDVLRQIGDEELGVECIVLTGHAALETGLQAMKLGAYDYVSKPASLAELEILVARAADKGRLRRENAALHGRLRRQEPPEDPAGADPAMLEALQALERAAPSDVPVLLLGEPGTGRESLARFLHRRSGRAAGPFVAATLAGLPEDVQELELFGRERSDSVPRRAGLLELADGGTLYLDEVAGLPPTLQVRLGRVLEHHEHFRLEGTRPVRTDVRLVAASSHDLELEVQAGRLRDDFHLALRGAAVKVPALRERRGDIALIAGHVLDALPGRPRLAPRASEVLQAYAWPGNVRELKMVLQRAALAAGGPVIDAADLPLDLGERSWKAAAVKTGLTLAEMEREYIGTVLEQNAGHRGKTARALGIDPKTLYNKLGPERPRKRSAPTGA